MLLQGALQTLRVQLPGDALPGLAWLEVQRGALISASQPLLILPNSTMAQECIKALDQQQATAHGHGPIGCLAVDLGLALIAQTAGVQACSAEPSVIAAIAHRSAYVIASTLDG